MNQQYDKTVIENIGKVLLDGDRPLKERFRALFTLKTLGGANAIDYIAKGFSDPSELLKHELAYCLGQMQNVYAIPTLKNVLQDENQEPIVRHEAAEALGAIGCDSSLEILEKYTSDPIIELAETCELAIRNIRWKKTDSASEDMNNKQGIHFDSYDPAPPSKEDDIQSLKATLLNENQTLFERYRAMFALRNRADTESALILAEGLKCKSALFRHEIAYVLGQLANSAAVNQLSVNLMDEAEIGMVRHECAEALGAIATKECYEILEKYSKDNERVVKESCEVALDMCDYANSNEFQYADALSKV